MLEFIAGAMVFGGGVALGWLLRGRAQQPPVLKVQRPRWRPEQLLDPVTPEEQRLAREAGRNA